MTTLNIFDFDSTLFLSPMLSCNLWHSSFINLITTENLIGPGWWRDVRSLELDNHDKLKQSQWEGYWNEDVVDKVRLSMKDVSHMTVLLTGRRYHPFHSLIHDMLSSKGLQFDLIGLRPDPEELIGDDTGLGFNYEPNVFDTTMEFKTSFIVNMLSTLPDIKYLKMWDDRISHIYIFQTYLNRLKQAKLIEQGELVCIKPSRPRYNPEWEISTVKQMIDTHNTAITKLKKQGKSIPKIITVDGMTSMDLFDLTSVPSVPSLILEESTSVELNHMFKSIYQQELLTLQVNDWESHFAEESMYFGNQILLSPDQTKDNKEAYQFKIIGRTGVCLEFGMILQVQLLDDPQHTYILPLWYKPSVFSYLLKKKFNWIPVKDNGQLFLAKPGHHHLLAACIKS